MPTNPSSTLEERLKDRYSAPPRSPLFCTMLKLLVVFATAGLASAALDTAAIAFGAWVWPRQWLWDRRIWHWLLSWPGHGLGKGDCNGIIMAVAIAIVVRHHPSLWLLISHGGFPKVAGDLSPSWRR